MLKLSKVIEIPKTDLEDYDHGERKLMALMAGVKGDYKTDYQGLEKPITIRLNANNVPKVDALAELSKLSKNLLLNDLIDLAFYVLEQNLSDEDAEKFYSATNKHMEEWIGQYQIREPK